jgi:preprotein translocase subunit SecA
MAFLRSLFPRRRTSAHLVSQVNTLRRQFATQPDAHLKSAVAQAATLVEVIALTAVVASRVLGLEMHDEQIQAALALSEGNVVEMQTGEGKTLAAVPAIVWHAQTHKGVHVLTANDYLARRDAAWMGGIYERLGLSVASINHTQSPDERRAAYQADITYATANEVGFDYLRDGLVYHATDLVQRPLSDVVAVIDEADSILIDEARVPLVIAGGDADHADPAAAADRAVRTLHSRHHFTIENNSRNVVLTADGARQVERVMGITNLFDEAHFAAHAAVQEALHAHVLLTKDVDYVVSDDKVLSVDEVKGRIVSERRWPAGLQTALEFKEGVHVRPQGRVLGSVTVENLVAQYAGVCGMTGTAMTQAQELRDIYGLGVVVIPPHRPVVRVDQDDRVFETRAEKCDAVVEDVNRAFATGQPVLVGTGSVEESEALSRRLAHIPHVVLNARNEALEAGIIARAGERSAVTISTNMAGRGVDIVLGEGVAAIGGLHVIGTNRFHSRRIDNQLRGRAGRQGDPGSSRFFVSSEDALFVTHADGDCAISADQVQRFAEGQSLDVRQFLKKYERVLEGQRLDVRHRREAMLLAADGEVSPRERQVTLEVMDELWSDYLAASAELRSGTVWLSLGGQNPHASYIRNLHHLFTEMTTAIPVEVANRLAIDASGVAVARKPGSTWTYLTTDEPFGPMTQRIMRQLVQRFRGRR